MHEAAIGNGEVREMYGAAARAAEQYHTAMLRYFRGQAAHDGAEKIRDRLEDYIASGQLYSTALELLLAALASSPLDCARDEAERIEGVLWRHDEQLRRLYSELRAGEARGRRSVSAVR